MGLRWDDSGEIGIQLYEKFPEVKPLTVRFTDLHKWICELEEFDDDAARSNEKVLEAVQMAWYEEWKADHEDDPDY